MKPLRIALIVAVLVSSLALGLWFGLQGHKGGPPQLQAGTAYPTPRSLVDFGLVDAAGRDYGLDDWKGEWRLVFFGFTHCPDVCPNTLAMLRGVVDRLEPDAPKVTFVSVDPERDTPEKIGSYAAYFHPDFEAVTGEHEELERLSRRMGIVYTIEDHEAGAMGYGVDHSAAILAVNPDGRLQAVFTAPHDPELIAADMKRLMENNS